MMIGNRPKEMDLVLLNRLYVWLSVERNYTRMDSMGWRVFEFAIMIPRTKPHEHGYFTKENYWGFVRRFAFWFPIDTV